MTMLRLERLTYRYEGERDRAALTDLSLEAEAGRLHWITGPLGAGCTTLLMAAAGLAPRYTGGDIDGRVELLGVDPQAADSAAALAGRVAFVTASPSLQLSGIAETVFEEVAFAPANLGWPVERIGRSAADALERLEVGHLAERDPRHLSGGETQRVVLAAMLALKPEAWFLDEAGSALDPDGRRLLGSLMRDECRRGALVVTASEDVEMMAGVADRMVVLGGGRIVADSQPRSLLETEAAWTLGIGSTGTAELARAAARHAGAESPMLRAPYPLTVEEGAARWSR